MYWVQTIREHLKLSQEELAGYLGLSLHTIKSVETGRRHLPIDSLGAALAIFNAIKESPLNEAAANAVPPADHHLQQAKRHHQHCCCQLDRHMDKLDTMQRSYAHACVSLDVYQRLEKVLSPSRNDADQVRLQWTQRKIKDATQCIKDNNASAQHLLAAKIAGLRSLVQALEGPPLNAYGPGDN